ncbi:hypothetical protein L3V82_07935 [Thiotrichales bacterium 19S3-7]|nr:hypothetical protein [Thiotrichales bacterium 19S3-7]MCF6802089.1 hypothetical protein [Thiotrichales bacterium 19S3-11]
MDKPQRVSVAVALLYASSILGAMELLMSGVMLKFFTPLIYLDLIAYAVLIIIAYFISKRLSFAVALYIVVAVIWYAVLIGILPWKYGHTLNTVSLFGQFCLTIAALILLFQKKSIQWFKENHQA